MLAVHVNIISIKQKTLSDTINSTTGITCSLEILRFLSFWRIIYKAFLHCPRYPYIQCTQRRQQL